MDPREQFSANLVRLRNAAQMTQMQLSNASDLHATEISRLEQGIREPRLMTLVKLARGLGIHPGDFFEQIDDWPVRSD